MYFNPRKYTLMDAPRSVRRRWAAKGAKTRLKNLLERCRSDLHDTVEQAQAKLQAAIGEYEEDDDDSEDDVVAPLTPTQRAMQVLERREMEPRVPTIVPEVISATEAENPFSRDGLYGYVRRRRGGLPGRRFGVHRMARNPELLVVNNPGGMKMRRRKRIRRRNKPLTVRHGGKNLKFSSLVKKLGRKRAMKLWRKRKVRYHGSSSRIKCRIVRRRSKAKNPRLKRCRLMYKGRKRSWKGLVRLVGVKKASQMWRKGGMKVGKKHRARKSNPRRRRRSRRGFRGKRR